MRSLWLFGKKRFLSGSLFSLVLILFFIANLILPLPSVPAAVLAASSSSADLGVTKSDGVSSVPSGTNTIYTIRVTTRGPDTVTGAVFRDAAGTGLQPVSVACSSAANNQCSVSPNLAGLTGSGVALPTLANGQFYEVLLTVSVTAQSGSVKNTAFIGAPPGTTDPNSGNNQCTDTDTVTPPTTTNVDLGVTKTDGTDYVNFGGTTVYTIRVTNYGPLTVTGAVFRDVADSTLNLISVACSTAAGNRCATSPSLSSLTGSGIVLPTLVKDQFYEVLLTAVINAQSGSIVNTAYIAPPTGITDTNPSNDSQKDVDIVVPETVDLGVTKDDGVVIVTSGTTTTYTIRVTNNGTTTAIGAVLKDIVGAGLSATSVACSSTVNNQCTVAPTLASLTSAGGVTLPVLTGGQFYEILLTVNILAQSGSVINTAEVSLANGQTDSNPANNTATDTDIVVVNKYAVYLPLIGNETGQPNRLNWEVALGYEDLPLTTGMNDFDYNDWTMDIDGYFTYQPATNNMVQQVFMTFLPHARGALYSHQLRMRFPANTFASDGTAVLTLYDANHTILTRQSLPFTSGVDTTYVIFNRTSDALPGSTFVNTVLGAPHVEPQRFADLQITFNTPFPFTIDPNNFSSPHGMGLFFDPYLYVINTNDEVHRGDVRLLSVPETDWLWPQEHVRIDKAYPLVTGTPPNFIFPIPPQSSWWMTCNQGDIYVWDSVPVTCKAP